VSGCAPAPGDIAGAILAGGRSTRFGQDKVLLLFRDKPLLAHLRGVLEPVVSEMFIVGHPRPEFELIGLRVLTDLISDAGPLGGIYTALESIGAPFVLVVAADMPFLSTPLLRRILEPAMTADAVIPRGPRGLEPLCAVYSRSCIDPIRRSLDKGDRRIVRALQGMEVLNPEILVGEDEKDPFFNINYPEDYERLDWG
jgi:molybdopterin-guanine dinucleotide biosynthesis protein A